MDPGQTSSAYQPFNPTTTTTGKQTIQYVCALHPQEQATLTIYPDFTCSKNPITGKVNLPVRITEGGVGPFDVSKTAWPAGLAVDPGLAGISVQSRIPLKQTINLNVSDSLGVNIQQAISLEIT